MNLKEYIESGKLETYVLGGLNEAESREVERFAREYPEIAHELSKIQLGFEKYVQNIAITPPAAVKAKLMEAIDSESNIVLFTPFLKFTMAASFALVLTLAATTFYYQNKWQSSEQQLSSSNEEKKALQEQALAQRQTLDEYQSFAALVADTSVAKIILNGTAVSPTSNAIVFWNSRTKEVFLDPNGLPGIPADKQYQLWAIVNGNPVDMGVFETGNPVPVIKMKTAGNVQAFAITLETKGGNPTPTLEAMYVLGQRG